MKTLLLLALAVALDWTSASYYDDFVGSDNIPADLFKDYPSYGAPSAEDYPQGDDDLYNLALEQLLDSAEPPEASLRLAQKAAAKPRAEESVQQPGVGGPLKHTGGSDKGENSNSQNPKVKTDASLPAYCDPPNPCPIGMKASDGCQENGFVNTAEYVKNYQANQDCECDRDHMRCDEEKDSSSDELLKNFGLGLNPLGLSRAAKKSSDASSHFQFLSGI